ncbi:MAG: hypothetical protein WBP11_00460 [Dokdonella sp.]
MIKIDTLANQIVARLETNEIPSGIAGNAIQMMAHVADSSVPDRCSK